MIEGLTTVVIPTYQHGAFVADAIESALAQTAQVEVVVVDDGSTDNTKEVLSKFGDRVEWITIDHSGLPTARNIAIDAARGEFLMFLDADDVIAPTKVEKQLRAMTADVGWVLCDVMIQDVNGKAQLASERYDYAGKRIGEWVQPLLGVANFIPVHSPLVRRSVVGDIRFEEKTPEDWHFWYAIAGVAKCRYIPDILATYKKRRGGRNSWRWKGLQSWPGVEYPLRLNLGCGTRGNESWHPIRGFVNMDKSLGWKFEDGLRGFAEGSVDGITISHSLMFVSIEFWPRLFAELARVLRPGGVLRVTEDDTTNASSSRLGGWKGSQPAITLTDAAMLRTHMEAAGLTVHDVDPETTRYADDSLRQAWHGEPPHVFHIEGVRSSAVLFSPHSDDESLFAAFTIIRNKPRVVICFPSVRDYGDTNVRLAESQRAVEILGGGPVEQWDGTAIEAKMRELDLRKSPERVWAPSPMASHPEHVAVAIAARNVFGDRVTEYQTYKSVLVDLDHQTGADAEIVRCRGLGKVRLGELVPFEPGWAEMKRQALACYRTQIEHPRAKVFFEEMDLAEYSC